MKYIKTYEKYNSSHYEKGDYVILNIDEINTNNEIDGRTIVGEEPYKPINNMALVTKFNISNEDYPYIVKFYNDDQTNVGEDEILRKMTPEEILEFNIKKEGVKYNL